MDNEVSDSLLEAWVFRSEIFSICLPDFAFRFLFFFFLFVDKATFDSSSANSSRSSSAVISAETS